MRLAKLKHFSIGLSRNYLFKHIKATLLAKKMLTWTQPQYVKKDCVQKYNIFLFFFLNWDLLHARLKSHYDAWSYIQEKEKD